MTVQNDPPRRRFGPSEPDQLQAGRCSTPPAESSWAVGRQQVLARLTRPEVDLDAHLTELLRALYGIDSVSTDVMEFPPSSPSRSWRVDETWRTWFGPLVAARLRQQRGDMVCCVCRTEIDVAADDASVVVGQQ